VVYNGVDLAVYHPQGPQQRPESRLRILLVEGSLMGGYEQGLESAVRLAEALEERKSLAHSQRSERSSIEVMVVGRIAQSTQEYWRRQSKVPISWTGLVPAQRIPELARSAHMLYSADLNPACPNSVIEALACGLPVLAFDTGALPEMVPAGAGRVVPYGGNSWVLDPPDIPALADGAEDIYCNQDSYRDAARLHAEQKFGLDPMVEAYMHVLQGG
jgi:glycosyltransferase involved in cell wall biosynthesis